MAGHVEVCGGLATLRVRSLGLVSAPLLDAAAALSLAAGVGGLGKRRMCMRLWLTSGISRVTMPKGSKTVDTLRHTPHMSWLLNCP